MDWLLAIFSRSLHGAVYYPPRDSMIVYGGTTLNGLASPSLIEFHFGNEACSSS